MMGGMFITRVNLKYQMLALLVITTEQSKKVSIYCFWARNLKDTISKEDNYNRNQTNKNKKCITTVITTNYYSEMVCDPKQH